MKYAMMASAVGLGVSVSLYALFFALGKMTVVAIALGLYTVSAAVFMSATLSLLFRRR